MGNTESIRREIKRECGADILGAVGCFQHRRMREQRMRKWLEALPSGKDFGWYAEQAAKEGFYSVKTSDFVLLDRLLRETKQRRN